MAELLLELFSEEIPARMQPRAGEDLARLVGDGLKAAGLDYESARTFATPRRLTLVIDGLPGRSPDVCEEKRGPRVGAPDQAIQGFLRGAGLASIDQADVVSDPKKGDFYVARLEQRGRPAGDVVAEVVPAVIRSFPWPKSMRWGSGHLRWVRPLHSILCLLDGKLVRFEVDGLKSGRETRGHRFMAPKSFSVSDFDDYAQKLRKACVILDPAERRDIILKSAKRLARNRLTLVEDEALLLENAGLTEWPVPLMGSFDEAFLDVPPEVLITAMKSHQKYFSLRDPAHAGDLANRFIMVANLEAGDKGKAIAAGNERVIRARLSDAKFFWDQDRKVQLEARVIKLKDIVFHEKLGSQYERVQRLRQLARALAPMVGASEDETERAAILAKADLLTGMVGEFPELQGVMGRYYARDEGELPEVADAIADHYKPQGPSDAVPKHPVSIAVALADKLDMLVGFWAIDEKPTGSKDPYALRRAALGVIRIVLENELRLRLQSLFMDARKGFEIGDGDSLQQAADLLSFFADRLKVHLREEGARHDLIDAVFSLGDQEAGSAVAPEARVSRDGATGINQNQDDLLMIVRRVEALGRFLATDDGEQLLIGVKRAVNILRIEEKKDGRAYDGAPDPKLFVQDEEKALARAIDTATAAAGKAIAKEDFEAAMRAMAGLRAPVDAFFDHVTVNSDEPERRENRLKLLNQIRAATLQVADFSKIEG